MMSDLLFLKNKNDEKFRLAERISSKWETIGLILGIEYGMLEAINKDHSRSEDKLRKVFSIWLENAGNLPKHGEYPYTWKGLKNLLEDIGVTEVSKAYFKFLENAV